MPQSVETLVDVLRAHAARDERELYRFCPAPEAPSTGWTRRGLDVSARAWAHAIADRTSVDGPVLVLATFGRSFPLGFFACLYARRVAVPALCPDAARSSFAIERLRHIVRDVQPELVLVEAPLPEAVLERVPELRDIPALAIGDADADALRGEAELWRRPDGLAEAPAFVQYTSGSTRDPRGVVVTHQNLFEHQLRAHEVFGSPEGSTTVSWLPFHHDMGLIGAMLYPLFVGGRGVFMPPASFLRRPMWWLKMVSEMRARTSTAPNFAYDVCTRKAKDEEVAALDLSEWAITVCGAEPVRASTMRAFAERFAPAGFRPQTFLPCFGLAEATLVGTASDVARIPVVRSFDAQALRRGQVEDVDHVHPKLESHVACGRPTSGHEIAIVDPETLTRLPDRRVGEIWMRGPSVARRYWGRPEESRAQLGARPDAGEGDAGATWMRSGDVGALVDGELFVFGRVADFIRLDGEWWAPTAFEDPVDAAPPRGVSSGAVAFAAEGPEGRPSLTLAVETRRLRDDLHAQDICQAITDSVRAATGVRPDRVLLLPPRTIARTSSGKLRRYRYREMDARGELPLRYVGAPVEAASSTAA